MSTLLPAPCTRLGGITVATLLLASALPAQDAADSFLRFTGVDLFVNGEADQYRPVDTLKKHEVILAEPGLPRLRLREVDHFRGEAKTKLSRARVIIADFEQHRVTSVRNDRALQSMSAQSRMADYQQRQTDWAGAEVGQTSIRQSAANRNRIYLDELEAAGMEITGGSKAIAQRQVDRYNADAIRHAEELGEQAFQSEQIMVDETNQRRALDATRAGNEDIMELTFTLASPNPIAEAYVVVRSTIQQGEERGIATFHHIVGTIGPKPRKVRIRQTGFEPGFAIEDVKLHLFAHGKELATNVSRDAVAMTRDEVREFLLRSHLTDHAAESVAPAPVWNLAPADLFAAKSARRYDYPVVATIDTDGHVISIHDSEADARAYLAQIHDAADLRSKSTPGQSLAASIRSDEGTAGVAFDQSGRAPARVVSTLRDMVFLPALELGQPVPGTIKVNLADFFR